jgi:hypothetical protein
MRRRVACLTSQICEAAESIKPLSGCVAQSRASRTSVIRRTAEEQLNGSVLHGGVMNYAVGMVKHNRS